MVDAGFFSPQGGGANLLHWPFLPKICMKFRVGILLMSVFPDEILQHWSGAAQYL